MIILKNHLLTSRCELHENGRVSKSQRWRQNYWQLTQWQEKKAKRREAGNLQKRYGKTRILPRTVAL